MSHVITCTPVPAPRRVITANPQAAKEIADALFARLQKTAKTISVDRQAAIENALSMALYFIRQPGDTEPNLWAATARANRALTLLKQSSQGNTPDGSATTMGRA